MGCYGTELNPVRNALQPDVTSLSLGQPCGVVKLKLLVFLLHQDHKIFSRAPRKDDLSRTTFCTVKLEVSRSCKQGPRRVWYIYFTSQAAGTPRDVLNAERVHWTRQARNTL